MTSRSRILRSAAVLFALLIAVSAPADTNKLSNIVGFQKVTVTPYPKAYSLASMPFVAENPNIDHVIGPQLTGGNGYSSSDDVMLWDVENQRYLNYFVAGGVGEPWDGHWFNGGLVPATNCSADLYPGRAFWIRSRQSFTQTVMFAGSLVSADCVTTRIPSGLSLLGYPYSCAIKLNETTLSNGACGGDSFGSSDNILKWDAEGQKFVNYFLAGDVGMPEYNWKWIIPQGLVVASNVYLRPGEGFWYRHRGSGFDWVETRPYSLP